MTKTSFMTTPVITIQLLTLLLFAASVTVLVILERKRLNCCRVSFLSRTIVAILVFSSGYILCNNIVTINTATEHGCENSYKISLQELRNSIALTPVEDKLPKDLRNTVIIYYRFGCTDCEKIYTELSQMAADRPNVYWISTRSKQGKKLREEYPVTDVPMSVTIDEHLIGTTHSITTKTKTGNDVTIQLNTKAVQALFLM